MTTRDNEEWGKVKRDIRHLPFHRLSIFFFTFFRIFAKIFYEIFSVDADTGQFLRSNTDTGSDTAVSASNTLMSAREPPTKHPRVARATRGCSALSVSYYQTTRKIHEKSSIFFQIWQFQLRSRRSWWKSRSKSNSNWRLRRMTQFATWSGRSTKELEFRSSSWSSTNSWQFRRLATALHSTEVSHVQSSIALAEGYSEF